MLNYATTGRIVFGPLADPPVLEHALGSGKGFIFAFMVLPPIIFISSFFTVLYYFGVLQWVVRIMAKIMMFLLGTSGAESLSVSASVFMGQTDRRHRQTVRVSDDSIRAAVTDDQRHGPCLRQHHDRLHPVRRRAGLDPDDRCDGLPVQPIPDKAAFAGNRSSRDGRGLPSAGGRKGVCQRHRRRRGRRADGLRLALNVAAMLIAFLAFIALFNGVLGQLDTAYLMSRPWWPGVGLAPTYVTRMDLRTAILAGRLSHGH